MMTKRGAVDTLAQIDWHVNTTSSGEAKVEGLKENNDGCLPHEGQSRRLSLTRPTHRSIRLCAALVTQERRVPNLAKI